MDWIIEILFVVVILMISIRLSGYIWKPKFHDIPGPPGLPYFGNVFQLDKFKPHETVAQWAKEYGDIMKIKLFGEDIIVVNSCEGITEMSVTKSSDYAGRPTKYRYDYLFKDHDLILHNLDPKTSFLKKTCMIGLKQVGEKIDDLEEIIMGCMDKFMNSLTACRGQDVDVRAIVHEFVAHINFVLVFGRGLSGEDHKEFLEVNVMIHEYFNPTADNVELDLIPFLRGPWYHKYRALQDACTRIHTFFKSQLKETVANHSEGETKCALDSLISQNNRNQHVDTSHKINLGNIRAVGINLTSAGTASTSGALYFLMALMAMNQDVQSEMHSQILKVIGHRSPTLKDRFSIPYVESCILEMLRLMSHVPFSVPHKAMVDTTLLGHKIPQNTEIWQNLWFMHHDEKLWEDPWKFKPKRFLDNEGNLLTADHLLRRQFLAFGAGRRVCCGETMAKNRLFLTIITLLQNFRFQPPEEGTVSTDPRDFLLGFALRPDDFKVNIQLWNDKA